jgi:hypothetical protein
MHVWVLQGEHGEDPEGLEALLRHSSQQLPSLCLQLECQRGSAGLAAAARRGRPDLLVTTHCHCPPPAVLNEVLPLGISLMVAATIEQAEAHVALAGRYPIHLLPLPVTANTLALGLVTAAASHYRQLAWSAQVAQLQQRLQDRILVERAKGILVQRLGTSEEDAYKRLRVLSRQQRRPIRDIAQSVIDTQQLLLQPPSNGLPTLPPRALAPEEAAAPLEPVESPGAGRWPEKAQALSKE